MFYVGFISPSIFQPYRHNKSLYVCLTAVFPALANVEVCVHEHPPQGIYVYHRHGGRVPVDETLQVDHQKATAILDVGSEYRCWPRRSSNQIIIRTSEVVYTMTNRIWSRCMK